MFERFTPRARRVIVLAQDAARDMGHSHIKPDHLLIGLTQGDGVAASAMAHAGVDAAALRQKVAGRWEISPTAGKADRVPFSPEAKKCLELSLRESLTRGHNYIGTEHLFFGVEREAEDSHESLEEVLGVAPAEIHTRLEEMVRGLTGAGRSKLRSPALQAAMERARQQAGPTLVTTGHVLNAILADPDSQAARALASLGVEGDAVQVALETVTLAGTTDATPPPESVAITIGDQTVTISDTEVATALQHLSAGQLRDAIKRGLELS